MATRCDICCLDLQDKHSYQGHIAGKRHQKNVQYLEFQKRITEHSIFVFLPPKISREELINFFAQFGTIKKYIFGPRHLIIEYADGEPAQYLLSNPMWLGNTRLLIKKRIVHNSGKQVRIPQTNDAVDESNISYEKVKDVIDNKCTFEEQLEAFRSAIELSADEVNARYESTRTRLQVVFKCVFPKCKLNKFGSTVTGLGFKECDLDLCLNIGERVSDEKHAAPNEWTPQKVLREVKKMMYRMNTVFSKVVPIPKAKIPIIKFLYVPTQVYCDISFKNGLAVHNNKLIKFWLSLDVRLKPLMILIKYWARHFKISGSGRITNYALIMLTIFYLQQPTVHIVPTLVELQKTCVPCLVDGWQVNFDEKVALPPIDNDSSIPQLLHGFFSFYASYDFGAKVICPLDGITRSREDFAQLNDLPEYMDRYKIYANNEDNVEKLNNKRPMCVQDPIELSHNITACTGARVVETFKNMCVICAKICATTAGDNYKHLLQTLFTTRPKVNKQSEFKVVIPVTPVIKYGLPEDFETRTDIEDKDKFVKDNWLLLLFNLVKEAFEKVLLLNVEILCVDKEAKQQKVEVLSDVHSQDHEKIFLHCTGNHFAWINRKQNGQILNPSLSWLEKEALISREMVKIHEKQGSQSSSTIDFMCKYEMNEDNRQIILTVTDVKCFKKSFHDLGSFLKSKFPKIIRGTLMHIQQYHKY